MTAEAVAIRSVVLVDLPVELQARAEERHEELLRELAHVAHAGEAAGTPQRLLALVTEVRARYAPFAGPVREQILAARASGRKTIDLRFVLPESGRSAARALLHVLEEADAFCRSGDLLTLAAPPDLVRFRRWFFGEVERQLAGAEPSAWTAEPPPGQEPDAGRG